MSSVFTAAYKLSCGIRQMVYLEEIQARTRFRCLVKHHPATTCSEHNKAHSPNAHASSSQPISDTSFMRDFQASAGK